VWTDDEDEGYRVASGFKIGLRAHGAERPGSTTQEELRLYVPPPESKESNTATPLIRRFHHDIRADIDHRHLKRPLPWPNMTVDFFEMTRLEIDQLDRLVRDVEAACSSLNLAGDGVSVRWFYGPEQEPPAIAISPWNVMSISLQSTPAIDLRLDAGESEIEPLWQSVWDYLVSICVPERRRDDCREHYPIPPTDYARLLTSYEVS
jgi:hypothetical protein